MTDILTDARAWLADQPERLRTHGDSCHNWHPACLVLRLCNEIDRLREAIRRLADQDATLSVCEGNVTVTMDATLTPEEREAVERAANFADDAAGYCKDPANAEAAKTQSATLRGLLERTAQNNTDGYVSRTR